jgi:hypothetical protein
MRDILICGEPLRSLPVMKLEEKAIKVGQSTSGTLFWVFGCPQYIYEGKTCQANMVLSQDDYPSATVCRLTNLL